MAMDIAKQKNLILTQKIKGRDSNKLNVTFIAV